MKNNFLPYLLVSCLSLSVAAEESPRGRLADGRAYRTDENGTQLVDYIAELEVNVEAMNRRIVGLEDELTEKQRIIERLHRGESGAVALQGELREKTLAGGLETGATPVVSEALERAKADNARLEGELRELRAQSARRAGEGSTDRVETERLRTALDAERRLRDQDQATYAAVSRECAALRLAPQGSCDAAVALAVQAAVREGGSREAALRDELALARSDGATARTEAEARYQELESTITNLKLELGQVRATLTATETDLTGARSALAAAARSVETRPSQSAAAMPVNSVAAAVRPVTRDYATRSRLAVVDSLRGSMSSELNQVRSLVVTRDTLFSRAVGQGDRRLQFKPSPLLSTGRRTLDDIAAGIRSAEQVHELTRLRTDLAEIRALVQSDIDLLRRTGRAG